MLTGKWGPEVCVEGLGVRTHRRILVVNSLGVEERVALLLATQVLTPVACANTPLPSKNTPWDIKRGPFQLSEPCLFPLTLTHLRCQLSISRYGDN